MSEPEFPNRRVSKGSSIVDNAIYVDGKRVSSPVSLAETYRELNDRPGALAWIGLFRPTHAELNSLAAEFDLHQLAIEDAVAAHQRPKIERYGDTLFLVLRAATYLDDAETVEFGELHIFVGRNFVITVRHSTSPDLSTVRHRMEDQDPKLLALGTEAVLYAILDAVVDGYMPVIAGLENDVDEIETQVFDGDPAVSRRIYELSREAIQFQRATNPLSATLDNLSSGFRKYQVDQELQRYLRDVDDHVTHVNERIDSLRHLLADVLTVNATLVGQRQNEVSLDQNEQMKKISAWAAILFAPSLVGSIYGMNFTHMPELDFPWGYPAALGLMITGSALLYAGFKKRRWL
ncbi:magnesium and cobalt transport protein CorA [Saxibacter everestensis]|uniref:Magnesium and cobalt transport protein CorA n=1 Tax=Saxibacter everestensis TaxID=2909229 RepID=A0ABY8QSV5_9MICO|nr:magnesium and cobalt transport protein CorA [Brevibacteriaceae bacterium ZFBP1038]